MDSRTGSALIGGWVEVGSISTGSVDCGRGAVDGEGIGVFAGRAVGRVEEEARHAAESYSS